MHFCICYCQPYTEGMEKFKDLYYFWNFSGSIRVHFIRYIWIVYRGGFYFAHKRADFCQNRLQLDMASESFGDVSSIAFLFSYFIVPVMAIVILFITIYRFYKTNENATYAVITIAFAITELIYTENNSLSQFSSLFRYNRGFT